MTEMPRISQMPDTIFDGKTNPYVPPKELTISPSLKLHRDWDPDIDPVTYEVIRHNLWHINEEHGATIQRVSGSPVAMYALDLNPSILTEDGEFVYFGPYMQYMSGVTDTQVMWTLEYRSENPGIHPGDMFIANDPWVGAAHQQDVLLMCPVFHEDELFCWVTNCLHQYDIGGITPSSFCPSAKNAFEEGLLLPPTKIIEGDVIRKDIEDFYLRSSRRPDMVGLDFRAQMAGNIAARARVHQLIDKYGAKSVKSVMKKIINNAETAYLEKMSRLPDGEWSERTYVEGCRPGDRRAHKVNISLKKEGTELTFYNDGTAEQEGAMNATFSGWRGSLLVAVNELLCWDQYFCVGGALRHLHFDPTPGTLNCATHPASVSTAPIQAMEISLYPAYNIISKMIYPDPEMRKDIMCIGGTSQWPATLFRGTNQWDEPYGYLLVDPIGGAIGAFAQGDGISTGGQARTPICKLPNVEHTEQDFPLLFLYRKELTDSGGTGKYRGGMGAESCFIAHNVESINHDTLSSGNGIPTSLGMMGGHPSATNRYQFVTESDIQSRFDKGEMVEDASQVEGNVITLALRQEDFDQTQDDVYAVAWCGGGGFGDPLDGDPEMVAADVETYTVSPEAAEQVFAVVLSPDTGEVDQAATKKLRSDRYEKRIGGSDLEPQKRDGELILRATEYVAIKKDGAGTFHACTKCDTELGDISENFKDHCVRETSAISESNRLIGDPKRFIDQEVQFRRFYCPGCGVQIENEVAVASDPHLQDIRIDL